VFGILKSAVKAAAVVIDLPVAIVADAATLGGTLTDRRKPYTTRAVERFVRNVEDIVDPDQ
jgi:hypothetical protein